MSGIRVGRKELLLTSALQPEFEAGWFVGWNVSSATACRQKFGREFERVYYLHNLASGMKLVNYYMAFGGEQARAKFHVTGC